jgi:hypothetical protein
MRHPLLLILTATVVPLSAPLVAEDVMLSGAHFSYTNQFEGEIKADGRTLDWDSGQRFELHLRDYYFEQRNHHPFAEIGFFYEEHAAGLDNFDLDTETIAFRVAIGSAIPLWEAPDGRWAVGVAPELGAHIGMFSIDVNSAGQHSDDDAFRYGASAGISAWAAYNRAVSFGLGLIGSYWRATDVDITVPTGQGTEKHNTNPSGWDLGARFSVGFLF